MFGKKAGKEEVKTDDKKKRDGGRGEQGGKEGGTEYYPGISDSLAWPQPQDRSSSLKSLGKERKSFLMGLPLFLSGPLFPFQEFSPSLCWREPSGEHWSTSPGKFHCCCC